MRFGPATNEQKESQFLFQIQVHLNNLDRDSVERVKESRTTESRRGAVLQNSEQ